MNKNITKLTSELVEKQEIPKKGQLTTFCFEKCSAVVVVQLMFSCLWDVSWPNVAEKRELQLLNFFLCHDRSQPFGL
jgi:hypothetical protein